MEIAFLVLDEADSMFDMGFYPDLRKLIKAVPPADRRQTMLFSATLNAWVKNLAWEYTKNPFEIAIEPETVTVEEVEQVLYHVSSSDKMKLLLGLLKKEEPESVLVFCNTKRYAEIVAKRLRLNGLECEFIMGDLPQSKRLKIIEDIKAGKLRLLVATDVAARGLDIEGLALVVNYDLPNESENYVHRIGRTARAGKTGKAVSFASEQDVYELPGIERYIGGKIPSITAGVELFAEDKSEGKRIHTDFYEDRDRRDSPDSRDRRDRNSRSRGRRQKSEGGDSERRRGAGGQRSRERGKPRQSRGDDQVQENKPDVNLSELPMEERMAYYRKKYDRNKDSGRRSASERNGTSEKNKSPGIKGTEKAARETGRGGKQNPGSKAEAPHRKKGGKNLRPPLRTIPR